MPGSVVLPYFDRILERLEDGDDEVSRAFGRHVHWGYWDDPAQADGSLSDFALAAARLGQRVSRAAEVQNGQRVLDVGCGFGGTLLDLDRRFAGMDLWGLNIDERQLGGRMLCSIQPPGSAAIALGSSPAMLAACPSPTASST